MRAHIYKPDWYKMGVRFDHLIHDPRFWAAVAVAVLVALIVLGAIFGSSRGGVPSPHSLPVYPYGFVP